MTMIAEQVHRFTRREYYRMADLGFFAQQRVELLAGEILDMPPQNEAHVASVSAVGRFLHKHLGEEWFVRIQAPLSVAPDSDPEPDYAVVPATEKGRRGRNHPRTAVLAIEVAVSSLARDQRKVGFYAAAGIEEYWLVNVAEREIVQHTQPAADASAEGGGKYATVRTVRWRGKIACTVLPLPAVEVAKLISL